MSYTISGKADWSMVPPAMVGGIRRYIEDGIPPGHFLLAVLANDLSEACARADEANKYRIWDFVYFLYNYAPSECWGAPEKVAAWMRRGGLNARTQQGGQS